jgi:stage III sporulation protein AD
VDFLDSLSSTGISQDFIILLIKITGISILTEFAVSICKDMGENAIANKVDLGGKLLVISLSIPVISATLSGLLELLQ